MSFFCRLDTDSCDRDNVSAKWVLFFVHLRIDEIRERFNHLTEDSV